MNNELQFSTKPHKCNGKINRRKMQKTGTLKPHWRITVFNDSRLAKIVLLWLNYMNTSIHQNNQYYSLRATITLALRDIGKPNKDQSDV